ncbi:MAG: DUF6193 family natural product biosynthesis protein [Polyangiaceae bacterium]
MTAPSIEEVWLSVLQQEQVRLRRAVEAANQAPLLATLYPFFSANWLRFTRVFEWPYEFMPFISAEGLPDDPYRALDADHNVLISGGLDIVVPAVSAAISDWIAEHPELHRRNR